MQVDELLTLTENKYIISDNINRGVIIFLIYASLPRREVKSRVREESEGKVLDVSLRRDGRTRPELSSPNVGGVFYRY